MFFHLRLPLPRDEWYVELFGFPWFEELFALARYAPLFGLHWFEWLFAFARLAPLLPDESRKGKEIHKQLVFLIIYFFPKLFLFSSQI